MARILQLLTPLGSMAGALSVLLSSSLWASETAEIPDFSGLWGRNAFDHEALPAGPGPLTNLTRLKDGTGDGTKLVGDYNNPILKPEAAEIVKKQGAISLSGDAFPDPSNKCRPYSPPYTFSMQLGLQIVQTKDEIVMLYNQDDQVRHVRLNGAHPANLTPSAMGDSIGHYEGDTLVIDTVGVKVTPPFTMIDRYGTPQSEGMHLVERYRLIDAADAKAAQERHEKTSGRVGGAAGAMPVDPAFGKGLQLQFTVEDPAYLTMPYSAQVTYRRTKLDWQEQVCAENPGDYYTGAASGVPTAGKPDF